MACELFLVTKDTLAGEWPRVEPMIAAAVARSSLMDADYVFARLEAGAWQLWVVVDGDAVKAVVVTALNDYPAGRECKLLICTGAGMREWLPLLWTIEEWAKSVGCSVIVASARPGWERMLRDYRKTHVLLERTL